MSFLGPEEPPASPALPAGDSLAQQSEELKFAIIDKMQLNSDLDSVINTFMEVIEQARRAREIAKYKIAMELMRDFENIKSRLKVDRDWQPLVQSLKTVKVKFDEEMRDKDLTELYKVMKY